jgi:predicted P-loop ATPase
MQLDFKALNELLLQDAERLLEDWLPNGRLIGSEYTCGDLSGSHGQSFKVNINTGLWCDFADPEFKGGDLISLFAAIQDIEQVEAYKKLMDIQLGKDVVIKKPVRKADPTAKKPPAENIPTCESREHGKPHKIYTYYDENGDPLFYIARYSLGPDQKTFLPWTWNGGKWMNKHWPNPKPLYNLHKLKSNQEKPVLVVEGEKTADAAESIYGNKYTVTTWVNGSNGYNHTDLSPLHGRDILLWPDADEPGVTAMEDLGKLLNYTSKSVRIFRPSLPGPDPQLSNLVDGFDLADTLKHPELSNKKTLTDWAKPRIVTLTKALVEIVKEDPPQEQDTEEVKELTSKIEVTSETQTPTLQALPFGFDFTRLYHSLGILDDKMRLILSEQSVQLVISHIPELREMMWFDYFHNKAFIQLPGQAQPKPMTDSSMTGILCLLQGKYGFKKLSHSISNAAIEYALKEIIPQRSEPRAWLESLTWDGENRIDTFLEDMFSTDNSQSKYYQQMSRNIFLSLVARIMSPGCAIHFMPIFYGVQGSGKSRTLEILGGKWFRDISSEPSSKDFMINLQGAWVVELGELTAFNKSEQNSIKAAISRSHDSYRPVFGKKTETFARQCIIFGTTNENDFLKDPTGARRFYPVEVKGKMTQPDFEYIEKYREQFFAQALNMLKTGIKITEPDTKVLDKLREQAQENDPIQDMLAEWIGTLDPVEKNCITPKRINEALNLGIDRGNQAAKRVKHAMMRLGFKQFHKRTGHTTMRAWRLNSDDDQTSSEFLE